MTVQAALLLSCIAFLATHFLLSHPLRGPLVRAIGAGPFRIIYSIVALVTFGAMIYYYNRCGREPPDLWRSGDAAWIAGTILMWLASILLCAVASWLASEVLPSPSRALVTMMTRFMSFTPVVAVREALLST